MVLQDFSTFDNLFMVSPIGPIPPDAQAALDQFEDAADKIIEPLVQDPEAKKTPHAIYHYTNDVGLRGILETGQLWLTDVFSLNDPSELNHGFSLMLKVLMSKVVSPEGRKFAEGLLAFSKQGGVRRTGNYFVCCFSACKDDLGQWRAYADNGRGYVLGFDTRKLESAFGKDGDSVFAEATSLTYDDARLEDIHRQIVEKMFESISLPCDRAVQASWYTYLTLKALNAALHFKHESYRSEQEYRFLEGHGIGPRVSGVKLRYRPYAAVRYRE